MSLYDYLASKDLARLDPPFYALIFAVIRKADTDNLAKLKKAFPEQVEEFFQRYNAPGGALTEVERNFLVADSEEE